MKDNVFIDSNILIYCYHDLFQEKRNKSRELINNYDEVFISTQVLNEFISAFHKKLKADLERHNHILTGDLVELFDFNKYQGNNS